MKKYLSVIAAGVIGSAALMCITTPVMAASIDINLGVPAAVVQPQPAYVQPRPVYIQQQYENDWRERQVRAVQWRDNPHYHGPSVSASVHARHDAQKKNHRKHRGESKHND